MQKPYSVWLCPSPLRKNSGWKIQIQPGNSRVNRALNFSGDQKDKVLAGAASSSSRKLLHGAPSEVLDTQLRLGLQCEREGNFVEKTPAVVVEAKKSYNCSNRGTH